MRVQMKKKKHSKRSHSSYCVVASLLETQNCEKAMGLGKMLLFHGKNIMRKSHET